MASIVHDGFQEIQEYTGACLFPVVHMHISVIYS